MENSSLNFSHWVPAPPVATPEPPRKQTSPEDVSQNAGLSSSANPRVETCSGVARLNAGSETRMSSSTPEKKSLSDYKSFLLPTVAMPSHMTTSIGKILQVERIIGSDFFRIHTNAYRNYSRTPLLECLFSEAKRGKGLIPVSELIKDRDKYIEKKISSKEEYQKEAGQLIYLYLHLLLSFHDYGVENIDTFASYLDVKNVLVTNWLYLIKPKSLAEASLELYKKEHIQQDLQFEGGDSSVRFDYDTEKNLIEGFAMKMKEAESNHKKEIKNNHKGKSTYSNQNRRLPGHLKIDSSFTYQNLVNMLLDFLALNSGKKSRIVMASAPELVVNFLNRTFAERAPVSENSSSKSRESLEEAGAG